MPVLSVDLPWGQPGTWTAELDGPSGPLHQRFEVPAETDRFIRTKAFWLQDSLALFTAFPANVC